MLTTAVGDHSRPTGPRLAVRPLTCGTSDDFAKTSLKGNMIFRTRLVTSIRR
jgi:hypothetical protein